MPLPALRPRNPGEILDAGFQFMRAEFPVLMVGTGVFIVPPLILAEMFPDLQLLWTFLERLLFLAASAVPVVMVTDAYVGRPVEIGSTLSRIGQRFFSIWGAAIVSGLLMFGGLLLLIVPGVIAFARLFAMPSVVLAEGASTSESFERSKDLTRGFTGHILATLGVAYIIFWFAMLGLGAGMGFMGMSAGLIEFVGQIAAIVISPFLGVVSALLYIDLRVRKEALDVQLLAAALGGEPAPAAAL